MDWIVYPLRDLMVWTFENLLEPAENIPNYAFIAVIVGGLLVWLKYQAKYNAEAASNPDQIK